MHIALLVQSYWIHKYTRIHVRLLLDDISSALSPACSPALFRRHFVLNNFNNILITYLSTSTLDLATRFGKYKDVIIYI